jgi:hypothetical protein
MFIHEMFIDPVPSGQNVSSLRRQPTPPPTRKQGTNKPKKGLARFSSASMSTVASVASFGPIGSSAIDCCYADAVVCVKDAGNGAKSGMIIATQQPTASPFAAPGVQAGSFQQEGRDQSSFQQHAHQVNSSKSKSKIKKKLKAVAMHFANGLSWSAHARPALPVPIYPPVVM